MISEPKRAILWTNGGLMVFDQDGKQMPDLQGFGPEKVAELRRLHPSLPIERMDWNRDVRPGLSA